jgi:hypothetical protein
MHREIRCAVVAAVLLGVGAARPAAGQVSAEPAALVIFPHLLVDGSRGIDTVVALSNASADPVDVRCLYEDMTPECHGAGGGTCAPGASLCDGPCEPRGMTAAFRLHLTDSQPLGWSIARGLLEPPLEANAGTRVPPVDTTSFQGTLRCVVVDDQDRPTDRNVLAGTASIEGRVGGSPPGADAAQYTAVGLAALPGANDGDDVMQLGGGTAEYAACPGGLVLPHFFDGATLRTGDRADTVSTTLSLVPCGGDLLGDPASGVVVEMQVRNEFAQRFSTSRALPRQFVSPLSLIDTAEPNRSIFSVGVSGTLTGESDVRGVGGGVVGVAIESHRAPDAEPEHHAALRLFGEGAGRGGESLAMLHPPCHGDCNGDGQVMIDELMTGVAIALDTEPLAVCRPADSDASGAVRINEITAAVEAALSSCPRASLPTPTAEPGETPSPTPVVAEPGPEITFLGIASADDQPQQPIDRDDQGRPIYTWPVGQGFSLIVEARPGANRTTVGLQALASADALPDLQVILSRPIGDGSAAVCDADLPAPGGVPAVEPFAFSTEPEVVHAINDLGCRADDGLGEPKGRSSARSCLRIPPDNRTATLSTRSTAQFCIPIARAWAFQSGDTVVAARVRDVQGMIGPVSEMVIRVPENP